MSFPFRAGRIPQRADTADDERDEEHMAIPTHGTVPVGKTVFVLAWAGHRRTVAGHAHSVRVRRR